MNPTLSDLVLAFQGKHPDAKFLDKLSDADIARAAIKYKTLADGIGGVITDPTPDVFAERLSAGRWKNAPHLKLIGRAIADAVEGKEKFLMISVPPRHGKTELCGRWFPLWALAKDPMKEIVYVSYAASRAEDNGKWVRDQLAILGPDLSVQLDEDKTAVDDWYTTRKPGGMKSVGVGGAITGRGADILLIDDIIKDSEEARSQLVRDKHWDWWQETAFTRLNGDHACVIIIATRWHHDDLLGRLERESLDGTGLPFKIINIPAEAEEGDAMGRKKGEWLWPSRFSSTYYMNQKKTKTSSAWSALFQQRPTSQTGNMVFRDWWGYFDPTSPFDGDQMIQSWDLPFNDKQSGSYAVGAILERKGMQIRIRDLYREHASIVDVAEQIKRWGEQFPKAVVKLVEDKASGPALMQLLRREVGGFVPINPKGEDKLSRLTAIVPFLKGGGAILPQTLEGASPKWVDVLLDEFCQFPKATHDDIVDCVGQGIRYLLPHGWLQEDSEKRELEDEAKIDPLLLASPLERWKQKRLQERNSHPLGGGDERLHSILRYRLRGAGGI